MERKSTDPNFEEVFPKLTDAMLNFNTLVRLEKYQSYCKNPLYSYQQKNSKYDELNDTIREVVLPYVWDEIVGFSPEWIKLNSMNNGQVCIHTLNVLYLVFTNTEIKTLSFEDQNLLKWAALLHDMCKLTTPKI